jgi:hypothetical protein
MVLALLRDEVRMPTFPLAMIGNAPGSIGLLSALQKLIPQFPVRNASTSA